MMETLLIRGGSLRAKDNYGETPIFYAVRKGDLKLVEVKRYLYLCVHYNNNSIETVLFWCGTEYRKC